MQSAGSFVILELEEDQVHIVENMWSSLKDFYSMNNLNETSLGHQILLREGQHQQRGVDNSKAEERVGYRFVQTYMTGRDQVLPTTIQDALNHTIESKQGIEDSFKLFAEIGHRVATILSAGILRKDPLVMNSVVKGLLHDGCTTYAGAYHRLSRYIITPEERQQQRSAATSKKSCTESLRSHTDWTVTTPIPLSDIPGLHLWKPNQKGWIAPEKLVQDLHAIKMKDPQTTVSCRPRTHYVVVMAGKWMELLTNGQIPACIHRVVTQTGRRTIPTTNNAAVFLTTSDDNEDDSLVPSVMQRRLSAPFFLRPKTTLFEMVTELYNQQQQHYQTSQEAISEIYEMFDGFIEMVTKQQEKRKGEDSKI